jgi:hypothetical protein
MVVSKTKTGDHKNVPIAFGMFPSETTDNFLWMFLNLKSAGAPLENMAMFCDRGKQMNAAKRLYSYGCNWLHIKNCTYHISKNVCARYSPRDIGLRNMIFGLQSSKSMLEYIRQLVDITIKYGSIVEGVDNIHGVLNENHYGDETEDETTQKIHFKILPQVQLQ